MAFQMNSLLSRTGILSALLLGAACTAQLDPLDEQFSESTGDGDQPSAGGSPDASAGGSSNGGGPEGPTGGSGPSSGGSVGVGGGASGSGGSAAPGKTRAACKRGVPFDVGEQVSLSDLDALKVGAFWFYDWTFRPNNGFNGAYEEHGFSFVPMIWNGNFDTNEVIAQIPPGATHLLGFNEPMIAGNGGVDMTLSEVLAAWPGVQAVADARDLTLVGPQVTFSNTGREHGPEFMEKFFAECPTCRVDAIGMHTYTCDVRWVRDHVEPYRKFGLPIWVTEFACFEGGPEAIKKFMTDTVAFFEEDPDIERYSWFMSRNATTGLLDGAGQLSELGELYVSLPHNPDCDL